MKKIRIVTDSSCDLNKDIVEKYNIDYYSVGRKEILNREESEEKAI